MKKAKKEFFLMVRGAMESPVAVDRGVALSNLVNAWKQDLPIIKEVCSGSKSFEKIVELIVEQNLQIGFLHFFKKVCFSNDFWRKTHDTGVKLENVLSLKGRVTETSKVIDITAPLSVSLWQSLILFLIPIVVTIVSFAIGYFSEIGSYYLVFDSKIFILYLGVGFAIGIFFATGDAFLSILMHLKRRRHLAKIVQEKARYLDRAFEEVYQN